MAARRHDPDSAGPAPDPHRPRVHFTPESTWMNDPNGLVLHEGRWHLFFQNNPLGSTPGNLSWGHAVSDDLASWTHLPVALRFSEEEWIFSGSVVHDAENRSGLGIPGDGGPLLAFYTSAYTPAHPTLPSIQAQSVAASTDGGTTWTRFSGNPVLDRGSRDFRDPKVLWHAESARWVMVTVEAEEYELHLYTSEDLLTWEHASVFTHPEIDGGIWECPDLVHVRTGTEAEGAGASAWVLVLSTNPGGPAGGSGTYTLLGDFDGRTFTTHSSPQPLDLGQDCYAAVSFSGVQGDPVLLGWMNNWAYAAQTPTAPWRSAMTLPRTLQLEADGAGDPVLVQRLVVPDGTRTVTLEEVAGGPPLDLAQPLRLHGVLPARSPWRLTLRFGDPEGDLDLVLSGDPTSGVVLDRGAAHEAPFAVEHPRSLPYVPAGGDDEVIVDLVVDRSCVEVELDRGRGTISQQVFHGTWQMSVLLQLDD
ncbi:glycoside hydrolase family 32 protein [Brachybacterium saurashtrense]|uniref:Glycoside hydrolase family 32 protein n=1 Tax=Brachybacterium saurashtrense TaxID=556288 RepID=A0A345YMX1_9MICO|nr:glycoside hydrolase family 32 protein [Brachybacterium saurashtrense]AXK45273.1 glycoside hydrolase family 32 protein [Brachybacterium saurashtrense]RRR21971.1 glycoside hydrolase family 32 protein [Brachybacterium saurashtrense]